jgi:hypothetical protein
MTNPLGEIKNDANNLYTLVFEGYEPTKGEKPYRFTVLPGLSPETEIFLAEVSVRKVRNKLEPGKKFILNRTSDNLDGDLTGPTDS